MPKQSPQERRRADLIYQAIGQYMELTPEEQKFNKFIKMSAISKKDNRINYHWDKDVPLH